jgi:hypothetical protein
VRTFFTSFCLGATEALGVSSESESDKTEFGIRLDEKGWLPSQMSFTEGVRGESNAASIEAFLGTMDLLDMDLLDKDGDSDHHWGSGFGEMYGELSGDVSGSEVGLLNSRGEGALDGI